MKAIVLAAGRGERLMPLTKDLPKSLVNLGDGRTLLDEQVLGMRHAARIHEVVFVVGYQAALVERRVAGSPRSPQLRTLFNPFYAVSNNLMSLWIARGEMDEDFLVTNGDNLFTPDVYRRMLDECGSGVFLALSPKRRFDPDDMKARVARGRVIAVAKTLPSAVCRAESPGLALVRGAKARALFRSTLDQLARTPKYLGCFWLELFNALGRAGCPARPWFFDGTTQWQEIDLHADVGTAQALLHSKLARLGKTSLRRIA
jgi:choline kinase